MTTTFPFIRPAVPLCCLTLPGPTSPQGRDGALRHFAYSSISCIGTPRDRRAVRGGRAFRIARTAGQGPLPSSQPRPPLPG